MSSGWSTKPRSIESSAPTRCSAADQARARILEVRLALIVAGSLASLAACASTDSAPGGQTTTQAAYVDTAASNDLYQVRSAQLALSRALRPEVRGFAQVLVQYHSDSSRQLAAAATASGMTPPPMQLRPREAGMIERLRDGHPAFFDKLYLSQQVIAQEHALALHQSYARDGESPALRAIAAAAVPVGQAHLERALALRGE